MVREQAKQGEAGKTSVGADTDSFGQARAAVRIIFREAHLPINFSKVVSPQT